MNKLIKYLFTVFFLIASVSFCLGQAQTKMVSGWVPYWDLENGLNLLNDNFKNEISQLNLFAYAFDKDLNIILVFDNKEKYKEKLDFIKSLGIQITATFTNDIIYSKSNQNLKEPDVVHRILSDDTLRTIHISQLLAIANEMGLDGIDIDYENIDKKDKELFSNFIKDLAEQLHKENRTLEVSVQQKTEDHQRSGAGSIDWKEISKYADKINIMCYNYSSRLSKPGPICPGYWLIDIINFAKTQIPVDKICIALPLYGYDWAKGKGLTVNIKSAKDLIKKYKAKALWDKATLTPHFIYYKNGEKHNVWFEDAKSILDKTRLIKEQGITNIAFWHISFLDVSFQKALKLFLE